MAIHKSVTLSNGMVHIVRVELESASENPLSYTEEVVLDLINQLEKKTKRIEELEDANTHILEMLESE